MNLLRQALAKLLMVGYSDDDVYLHCAPLFHIGGLSSMLAVLAAGGMQVRSLLTLHLTLRAPAQCMYPRCESSVELWVCWCESNV